MPESRDRSKESRLLLWLIHGGAVIFVVIVFMLMVMTAVAQQEVIGRIKEQQLALGYSSALAINQEARAKRLEFQDLVREERAVARQLRRDQVNLGQAQRHWEDAWTELEPLLERLRKSGACDVSMPSDKSFGARAAALNEFQQCQAGAAANPSSAKLFAAAEPAAKDFSRASEQYRSAFDAFSTNKERLDGARQQELMTALSPEQQKVSTSFSDMDVLLSNWMLLGGVLVPLPPAMLQILLTFFSGLFGAVLITLVLLVYPKSAFDVTATKETWSRVFLGGLIALCVYIVLLGGTAVLGASSGLAGAGSNYMAFCGIGILAGMFSDRAAFWLSDRANLFFRSSAAAQAKAGR